MKTGTGHQCDDIENGMQCTRSLGHFGDHKSNGLVWSNPNANDPIDHPAHYTSHPSGIECIQVTRHMNFNRGNAVKYIWRAGEKGPAVEDLKKAIWYLQDEIKRLESDPDAGP